MRPRRADDPGATLAEPDGAPDGRVVVATATALDGSASRIAAYDAAGGGAPLRALSSGPADSSPSVSPDGAQVAFTRGFDTWVVPLAGGPERLLARGVVDASWGGPLPGRPQLVPGSLRARGRRRDAVAIARSRPRGLRASLVGAAPAPRLVRVRNAGRATLKRGRATR